MGKIVGRAGAFGAGPPATGVVAGVVMVGGTVRAGDSRREQGFTLIELLIVIVILGILAAIVVFSVSGITDKGNQSACKADVASVTAAEEAYYANQTGTPSYSTPASIQTDLVPAYLHSWPTSTTISYSTTGTDFSVSGTNGGATC